jgi:hypothetical protein
VVDLVNERSVPDAMEVALVVPVVDLVNERSVPDAMEVALVVPVAASSNLEIIRVIPNIDQGLSAPFIFDPTDYGACCSKDNIYKPKLVVIRPGLEIFYYSESGASRVIPGSPEHNELVSACWHNLANIPDNRTYFARFQQWVFSDGLTDQEYIASLQATKDLKIQEAILSGLENPPRNPDIANSYLFPKKWHFVDGKVQLKQIDSSVKFVFQEGKFGIQILDSHNAKWEKLVARLKVGR